jgi:hypothetical protein
MLEIVKVGRRIEKNGFMNDGFVIVFFSFLTQQKKIQYFFMTWKGMGPRTASLRPLTDGWICPVLSKFKSKFLRDSGMASLGRICRTFRSC